MKTVCFYFDLHQNVHLKRYRFFDIGTDHYYSDDYENERSIQETAEKSYIPALTTLIKMCNENKGEFKCAFSISGCAIELFQLHAPQVITLLQQLVATGCCEVIGSPYSHGLSSLVNEDYFKSEVKHLNVTLKDLFGKTPKVFCNSCCIYSDEIGRVVSELGFKGMLTEGAKHILGWKSPHFVYHCAMNPKLKLLLRNNRLSEDISFRFNDWSWSEYPLFADQYLKWIAQLPEEDKVINLYMELCAFGIFQPLSSNILDFLQALPYEAAKLGIKFATPSEILKAYESVAPLNVADPITWMDEERDISPWLGNTMQQEAFDKLYSVADRVMVAGDKRIMQDWNYLQSSNNFRFMSTKPGSENAYRGIYDSPYDAFTNYMNILGDFIMRVNNLYPDMENEEISPILITLKNQEDELILKDKEIAKLQKTIALLKKDEETQKIKGKKKV